MLVGKVDIELEVAHYHQMVPQFATVFVGISLIGKKRLHGCHNAVSAGSAFATVFDCKTVVDHFLYVAPIFGKHKPFKMICICEHRILLWPALSKSANSGR